jgi:hypothetical protein
MIGKGITEALEEAGAELQSRLGDQAIAAGDLVASVVQRTGCSPGSVLPSDYAYNRVNRADFSRRRPLFIQTKRGFYRFVGSDYPYTGPVYWQPAGQPERVVGEATEGAVRWLEDPRTDS